MKISEVRNLIERYSENQLRIIITQLYKAMPKSIKEKNDIDGILQDPDTSIQSRPKTRQEGPDIDELSYETNTFVEDAYNQYYIAPNQFVPKRERPKWRFTVKRLYKDLSAIADENDVPEAAQLLEKLYQLLCYSCSYILFNAYDPFQSAGIEQAEFFRKVLVLKYRCEDKNTFIKNALLAMVNNPLNRYTLHENLMEVILEFTKTPDLKEMTIVKCSELIEIIKKEPLSKKEGHMSVHEKEKKLNNLIEMAFLCYARLYEYENAISYLKANYREDDKEITLYVLLRLLFGLKQKDYFLREYEQASKNGITPRDTLKKMYRLTRETGELPAYFG